MKFKTVNWITNKKSSSYKNDPEEVVIPNLPNGSIFITSDTNVHYMWDGTDTWNEVA